MTSARISFSYSEELKNELKELAEADNRSLSSLIQIILKEGIERRRKLKNVRRKKSQNAPKQSSILKPIAKKNDVTWPEYLAAFKAKRSKEHIISLMREQLTEKQATSLYRNFSCIYGAICNPNKKDGAVHQTVRHCLFGGPEPSGVDKSTVTYVKRIIEAYKVMPTNY